jgi:peptidoglycan/xylan/chitin deacetylase (PgdA/CDA1 family)
MLSSLSPGVYGGVGAAAGLGLVYGGIAYAANWPSSRLFGDALTAPAKPGELALTFDDGPNPAWTPRLLDILAGHDVRATFFVVGKFAEVEPALVRRIAAAGHLIGNHSWSHPNLALTAGAKIHEELKRTSATLEQIIGQPIRFFRPPFGARRPKVFQVARSLGLEPVLWNAMTNDWKEPSPDRIAASLSERVDSLTQREQAVNIVLHDGGHLGPGANREPSVSAARQLLAKYKPTHRFVTLDEWAL